MSSLLRTSIRSLIIGGLLISPIQTAIAVAPQPQQGSGVVTGTVIDARTQQPLASAQVMVVGTGIGTATNRSGRFQLMSVPAGEVTVRAEILGYGASEMTVTVTSGEVATVDFVLAEEALLLEELVVTGTAGDSRKRTLGNSVAKIDLKAIESAPVNNVSQLLNGRAPGVVVMQGTGVAGSGSKLRIRGRASMSLDDSPVIYIDGVRANNRSEGAFADASISRLDDLNLDAIESIEVIKGPAAATLYGTEASSGVIQIITKKGNANEPQLDFTMRQGASWFNDAESRIPLNYWRDPNTGQIIEANMVALEKARGTPIFQTGHNQYYALSLSGGAEQIQYYISGAATLDQGVTSDNTASRYNGQVSLSLSPWPSLSIQANTGVAINRVNLSRQGTSGLMPALMWGQPSSLDQPLRGFHIAPPEVVQTAYQAWQHANRFTPGLSLEHRPTDWFTQRLTFGLDYTDQEMVYFTPRLGPYEAQFFAASFAEGEKQVGRESVLFTTTDYSGNIGLPLTESLISNTSLGFQLYTKEINFINAEGRSFPAAGVKTIAGAGAQFGRDDFVANNTVGIYLQQQVGWNDRLFITGAIRADANSAFGENFKAAYYPKVSTAWVISEEEFWNVPLINSLRLRAAYGESGKQPDAFAAVRTFRTQPLPSGGSAVVPNQIGNPDLGPERGKEIELGFETAIGGDRIILDLTYYDQTTADAILLRNVAPSSGFSGQQYVNVGEVSNRGVELRIDANPLRTEVFDWDLGLGIATNRNRVTKLGIDGYLGVGWVGRHAEGYPVGSLWAKRAISADLAADGTVINDLCDDGQGGTIACALAPDLYIGQPNPKVEGSLTSSITLFQQLRLSGMLDFKLGQSKFATDRWNRCAWRQVCEINVYPERFAPKDVVAAQLGAAHEFDWWVQNSSFFRLREVSAEYSLPSQVAVRFGAKRARINLTARNLGTWTRYPELDPESLNISYSDSTPEDQATIPPLRQLLFTINLSY